MRASLVVGFVALAAAAWSQQLYAVSYSAPTGEGVAQGAPFDLTDQTGWQLTDGQLGSHDWLANSAYEWVGWRNAEPAIEFRFGAVVRVTRIRVGFARNEARRVFVPPFALVNWSGVSINSQAIANNSRGFVSLLGDWRTDTLRLHLIDGNNQRWILVDEVQFFTVPEPTSLAALTVIASLLLARRRVSLS